MARFGVLVPPESGHTHPTLAVARELRSRGHEVLFFQVLDGCARLEQSGFEAVPLFTQAFPRGRLAEEHTHLGRLRGMRALRYTVRLGEERIALFLEQGLEPLRAARLDLLIADEALLIGPSFAAALGIPDVTLCNALPLVFDPQVPPAVTGWRYSTSAWSRWRNVAGDELGRWLAWSLIRQINRFRSQQGLRPVRRLNDFGSDFATISQLPESFDFPRRQLPKTFHYAAPFDPGTERPGSAWPQERLTGEPLVYVSLGTLQNRNVSLFRRLAAVLEAPGRQVLISLGGGSEPETLTGLGPTTLVAKLVPQAEVLARAAWCVTHAGMNTTLECLQHGVPMLALPVTNDQPAVSARIEHHQVGVRVKANASRFRLASAFSRLLDQPRYRQCVERFRDQLADLSGAAMAADRIEQVHRTQRPVEREGTSP